MHIQHLNNAKYIFSILSFASPCFAYILHIFAYSYYVCIFCILAYRTYFTYSHTVFHYTFLTGFKLATTRCQRICIKASLHVTLQRTNNAGPEIPVDQLVQPPAVLHLPPFHCHQCICWLGGNETTMFNELKQMDAHIPAERVLVHSKYAGGGVRSHKHILHMLQFLRI